ncbi:hypothetical protein QUF72_11655 [Desulfobacterales bacterium HSG2]|nr:hypothetical protein [Desulfobacterales bacterium HSG2]
MKKKGRHLWETMKKGKDNRFMGATPILDRYKRFLVEEFAKEQES